MLLIGDPRSGKSLILREATQLVSRSIYTTGEGSSAAGLTAAAVRVYTRVYLEILFVLYFLI